MLEKPSFARSRPQARQQLDFSASSDTTSRVRRVISIDNFFETAQESPFAVRGVPLPHPSAHPHVQPPHPLSNPVFGAEGDDWQTPQNYKSAKPNILAFHSTGFVPKRGRALDRSVEKDHHGPQPDTPCKRTTIFPGSAFQTKSIGARIPMGDLGSPSPHPPPQPYTPVAGGNRGGSLMMGARRDSFTSADGYEQDGTQSSGEYELPPTPTKKSWNDFDDDSVFTVNKRIRAEDCRRNTAPPLLTRQIITNYIAGGPKARLDSRLSTPRTPKDNILPLDPSSLSISGKVYTYNPIPETSNRELPMPVTPARDCPNFNFGCGSSPLFADSVITEDGMSLTSKFSEVKHIGTGQFSEVYRVTERHHYGQLFTPGRSSESGFSSSPVEHDPVIREVYAVKRAKSRFLGPRDRRERMQEVQILKELGKHDHVVNYVDHWMDDGNYLCIQTEFCEEGSLDKFLEHHGTKGRLDEFRVWKMLLEICLVC